MHPDGAVMRKIILSGKHGKGTEVLLDDDDYEKTEEEAQRAIRLAKSGLDKEVVKQKVKHEFANL